MYEYLINSAYYNELHCTSITYTGKNYLSLECVKRYTPIHDVNIEKKVVYRASQNAHSTARICKIFTLLQFHILILK